jgi:hypothetical protein
MPVFSLEEARALQVKNISQNTSKYWSESAVYGYYVGGYFPPSAPPPPYPPSGVSLISRLDFSNETVSNPGKNLSTGRGYLSAVSNNSYGYFGGGYVAVYLGPTTLYNTISRLDFSNETVSDPGKNLPTTISSLAGTSSSSYGYFVGGGFTNTISRLDFSNENVSNPGKTLPFARYSIGAVSNSSYGYFAGGFYTPIPSYYSCVISRLDFSSETTSDPGKNLSQIRNNYTATSSNSYGYFVGGYSFPPLPPASQPFTSGVLSTITRLDFSNETVSNPGKNLPQVTQASTATSSSSYGYFGGGSVASLVNTISRLDFSNETVSASGNNLPTARQNSAAVSGGASVYRGSKTYGYIVGGDGATLVNTVSRLDFSNETVSNPGKNLLVAKTNFSGTTSSNYYGYFGGGYIPGTRICTITRLDFSNEITSDPGKNLPTVLSNCGGVSSNNYGYFGGGYRYSFPLSVPALRLCTITRLDFSTENVNNISSTLLGFGVDYGAAVMNNSYGYFGGGLTVAPFTSVSNITRLDFSNETTSALPTNLPANNRELAALSSTSYGYFGGGVIPAPPPPAASSVINTITRLDFSNEVISNPGKNLPTGIYRQSAVSSNFYGYFIGGWFPVVNTVSRIDFSNETVSLPGKNNLTPIKESATVSNSN